MSNNIIGQQLRTTLGLSQTAPATVTTQSNLLLPFTTALDGTDGNDLLQPSNSTNYTFGNGGNDTLDGSSGVPFFIGGTGDDTFVFIERSLPGILGGTVMDFESGDKIDLSGTTVTSYDQLTITMNDNNTNASVTNASQTLVLNLTSLFDLAGLNASNFIFADDDGSGSGSGGSSTASEGADSIDGSDIAEFLAGLGGADFLRGLGGNDTIEGGDGNDTINGNAGIDSIKGGADADSLLGGGDNDFLNGNAGNDTVNGNLGDDRVLGGADNDDVRGGQGNDTVNGNLGDDTIDGNLGDDVVYGGGGDDSLLGNAGNDTLDGNLGNDTLTGGEGNDNFYFSSPELFIGEDVITDFTSGTDILTFTTLAFADATAALAAVTYADGSAIVELSSVSMVTLQNITENSLTTADFSIIG